LDSELRASFRSHAEKLEERLAMMRSERNLLLEGPAHAFAKCAGNLVEAHATDLLLTLGQIASTDDVERLHQGRVAGKRLRYLLEPLRPYVHDVQPIVKQSKRLQDLLGDLNDVHVLMREIDVAMESSMKQRSDRLRASLRHADFDRAKREAAMSEWSGLLELYVRLEEERRTLVAKLRDRWLDGDLEDLVAQTRSLAHQLRSMDQAS
jgi:CHAD domain-containing protein